MPQPLAEVFGVPITDTSPAAQQHITDKLCPFNNKEPRCTKDRKADPLGVCSVLEAGTAHITCPVRFRQDWRIIRDAADFFFEPGARTEFVSEAYIKDAEGKIRGNADHVILKLDVDDNILDFGSLEVQAVYVTGNIRNPFTRYLETRDPDFTWPGPNYPSPDYLSSMKRLAQQIYAKGSILKGWNKKQAVALQTSFYATLPQLDRVPKDQADITWLLYEMRLAPNRNRYDLVLVDTVTASLKKHWSAYRCRRAGTSSRLWSPCVISCDVRDGICPQKMWLNRCGRIERVAGWRDGTGTAVRG